PLTLAQKEVVTPHIHVEGREALPVAVPQIPRPPRGVARQPSGGVPPEGRPDPGPESLAVRFSHLIHARDRIVSNVDTIPAPPQGGQRPRVAGRRREDTGVLERQRHGAISTHAEPAYPAVFAIGDGAVGGIHVSHEIASYVIVVARPAHAVALHRLAFRNELTTQRCIGQDIPCGVPTVVAIRHHDYHLRNAGGDQGIHRRIQPTGAGPVVLGAPRTVQIVGSRVAPRTVALVRRRQVYHVTF